MKNHYLKTLKNNTMILKFHIGRGGRFNNQGFLTFIGEERIDEGYPFEELFSDDERKEYIDSSGNDVGLTFDEAESGIGVIDIDGEYNTTYTTTKDNLTIKEKIAIAEYMPYNCSELLNIENDIFIVLVENNELLEYIKDHTISQKTLKKLNKKNMKLKTRIFELRDDESNENKLFTFSPSEIEKRYNVYGFFKKENDKLEIYEDDENCYVDDLEGFYDEDGRQIDEKDINVTQEVHVYYDGSNYKEIVLTSEDWETFYNEITDNYPNWDSMKEIYTKEVNQGRIRVYIYEHEGKEKYFLENISYWQGYLPFYQEIKEKEVKKLLNEN